MTTAATAKRTVVRPTTYPRLPAGVVIEIQRTAHPMAKSYPGETCYLVFVDGTCIGKVQSGRTTSYRKHGRIITGVVGHPRHWEAITEGWFPEGETIGRWTRSTRIGYHYDSRAVAIANLVEAWLKPHEPIPVD